MDQLEEYTGARFDSIDGQSGAVAVLRARFLQSAYEYADEPTPIRYILCNEVGTALYMQNARLAEMKEGQTITIPPPDLYVQVGAMTESADGTTAPYRPQDGRSAPPAPLCDDLLDSKCLTCFDTGTDCFDDPCDNCPAGETRRAELAAQGLHVPAPRAQDQAELAAHDKPGASYTLCSTCTGTGADAWGAVCPDCPAGESEQSKRESLANPD